MALKLTSARVLQTTNETSRCRRASANRGGVAWAGETFSSSDLCLLAHAYAHAKKTDMMFFQERTPCAKPLQSLCKAFAKHLLCPGSEAKTSGGGWSAATQVCDSRERVEGVAEVGHRRAHQLGERLFEDVRRGEEWQCGTLGQAKCTWWGRTRHPRAFQLKQFEQTWNAERNLKDKGHSQR